MSNDHPSTRAEARDAGLLPAVAELEVSSDPSILPLWMRRTFYVIGVLAGAGALIVGQYDPELSKNIAGAGVILVGSLALANPSR